MERLQGRQHPAEDNEELLAFEREGRMREILSPVYRFNALGTGNLLPEGGSLVDLGSGTGRFLSYLAKRRPDIRALGLELSEESAAQGGQRLAHEGMGARIELRAGDMTSFLDHLPARVDVVCCLYALHHLRTAEDLERCLGGIREARARTGCGFWLFDFIRPRDQETADLFLERLAGDAPDAVRRITRRSLTAAFTMRELREAVSRCFDEPVKSLAPEGLPIHQAHWLEPEGRASILGPAMLAEAAQSLLRLDP